MRTTDNWEILERYINDNRIDGETVLQWFTDYHGLQLMEDGFMEHIRDEGHPIEWRLGSHSRSLCT
jgi:hypothetical protein